MKLTFNTGNFALDIEGEVNEETQDKLLQNGMTYVTQREVATGVYLDVAGEDVEGKDGKTSRRLPKDFERSSVEYSEDTAAKFRESAEEKLSKFGKFTVSVSKYEGAEASSPMKRATNLVDSFLGTELEAAYRGILGLPKGSREELIEAANKRGLGVQPPKGK